MTNQQTAINLEVSEAKQRARAEIEAYRERRRKEREAREAAELTADQEIASAILARRQEEAKRAEIQAELQRFYAQRDTELEAQRQAERERKLNADPRSRIAETPARRAAKILRKRLGDDFDGFVVDLKSIDYRLLRIELERVPADERCEAQHRQYEELAAKLAAAAATLPVPENEAEAAILRNFGFATPAMAARQIELEQGAL